MGKTKIEWTKITWNPITGCTKYSPGCANCYAEAMTRRLKAIGVEKYKEGFGKVVCHNESLGDPFGIKEPSTIFVCSMADLFHQDVPFHFIYKVMKIIEMTPQHTYQILTKRASTMNAFFILRENVPENACFGTTVECPEAKERIQYLKEIKKAKVRFLSCEPLLSDLGELDLRGIDWVIVGGETGPKARPMKKEWVLNIKRQCEEQGVAFFFKQWGAYGEDGVKRNKKANGCLLDGKEYKQTPNNQ